MQIEERVFGEATILRLSGRMTWDDEYGVLTDKVRTLVQQGERRLVLNLAGLSYMDSTCIGEIVTSLVSVTNRGGTLNLVNLPPRITQLLKMAGLLSLFDVFGSEQDAVRGVSPESGTPRR